MTKEITISQALNSPDAKNKFQELLGKRASQFISSVLSVVNNNKLLEKATWQSVYQSAITAATLDLPINQNLGFAYIVPYTAKKKIGDKWIDICEAQFQLGYKGFIQLAQRSGKFKTINVSDVRQGEINEFDRLTGTIQFDWVQDDQERLSKPVIGYVAYFELLNGFSKLLYMTKAELETHGMNYSKSYNSTKKNYKTNKEEWIGLWRTNFDSMASKTALKLLLSKYAPLSTQMELALTTDQAVLDGEEIRYPDNDPTTVDVELKSELQKFIEDEVENLEALETISSQLKTKAEKEAYTIKLKALLSNQPKSEAIEIVEEAEKAFELEPEQDELIPETKNPTKI